MTKEQRAFRIRMCAQMILAEIGWQNVCRSPAPTNEECERAVQRAIDNIDSLLSSLRRDPCEGEPS